MFHKRTILVLAAIAIDKTQNVSCFMQSRGISKFAENTRYHIPCQLGSPTVKHDQSHPNIFKSNLFPLQMSDSDNEYSREIRLREEAESPFRKVRFLVYFNLLGGAFVSLALSAARIAAALAGVNTDLMQESLTNTVVDIVGIIVIGYFYKQDVDAQESKLKRAAKGASLANLQIRGSASLLSGAATDMDIDIAKLKGKSAVVPIKSFRRGRGIEKRIVIAISSKEKINSILDEAKILAGSLVANDLIIVPVVTPQYTAPLGIDIELLQLDCVTLPAGGDWFTVISDEIEQAKAQGVDVESEGVCIVLKKNGRVGTRTRGIFLENMVGDVLERQEMGMDVTNI